MPKFKFTRGHPSQLSPAWKVIHGQLPDQSVKNALTLPIYFLNRIDVGPYEVADHHIDQFIAEAEAVQRDKPESIANAAITQWNLLVIDPPLPPLTPRPTAQTRREKAWKRQGVEIDDALIAHMKSHGAGLHDGGRNELNSLKAAVETVAHHLGPVISIDDLLTKDAIDLIVDGEAHSYGSFGNASRRLALHSMRKYARAQRKLAQSSERKKFLQTALKRLKGGLRDLRLASSGCVTAAETARLVPYNSTQSVDKIVDDCVNQILKFGRTANRKADLPPTRGALATLLSIQTMRGRGLIHALEFNGPPRVTDHGTRPSLSGNIERILGEATRRLVDAYCADFTRIVGRAPKFLAEKLSGGRLDPSAFGKEVRRFLHDHGHDLKCSDVADLAIKLLIEDPRMTPESIADAAGFRTTGAFKRRFKPWLDARATAQFEKFVDDEDEDVDPPSNKDEEPSEGKVENDGVRGNSND